MSVWKGNQLIAANGSPGADGHDGRNGTDGQNGQGIMIRNSFVELHNNINDDGRIEITNRGDGAWCSVGGYNCRVSGGQGSIVYGRDCIGSGSGIAVFGYQNDLSSLATGVLIEGFGNSATATGQGTHIEGWSNIIHNSDQGAHIEGRNNNVKGTSEGAHIEGFENIITGTNKGTHIEGAFHTAVKVDADGGHQGGYGITANTPDLKLPPQKPGGTYQSTILEAIGLPVADSNGEYARVVRADGSMAINGDMSFIATKYDGTPETDSEHPDGVYTLGEIVRALHQAHIPIPKFTT